MPIIGRMDEALRPPLLEILNLRQHYGSNDIVRDVSLRLERGAIGCLLGQSGCGKTTMLRCIAGFEPLQQGEIRLNGVTVSAPGVLVPPEKRRIGMVFQDYALFPHLSVRGNIEFGLHSVSRAESAERVRKLGETVGLSGLLDKYPHELSGGQQQRVALARAMAPKPDLLLLDEPFSNLDVDLREHLSLEVRDILKRNHITAILVTHDQHEAFAMADEIGVLHEGRIQQWGDSYSLYHRPANRFVADFVGQGVFLPVKVLNAHQVEIELGVLEGQVPEECRIGCDRCGRGCHAEILLRPDDIVHDESASVRAEVVHRAFRGADILYTLRLPSGRKVLTLASSHHNHRLGESVGIRLDVDEVVVFPPEDIPAPPAS